MLSTKLYASKFISKGSEAFRRPVPVADREVVMSRTKGSGRTKKSNCCLTCLIVNIIILVVFFAALFIGGSILFKTYVSPHIGGVSLTEALSLAGKVFNGKEAQAEYTEEDLDSFYSRLSSTFFLSDKTEDEMEYELIPEEQKKALTESYVSAAEAEEGRDASATYDDEAAYAHFLLLTNSERYALLSDETRALVTQSEYSALAGNSDAAKAVREKLELKTYRLSVRKLMEGFKTSDGKFEAEGAVESLLGSLDFNFDSLEDYDIHNENAPENTDFTTFTLKGKETSAFINDVLSYLFSADSSPLKTALNEKLPADVDLSEYVKIAGVSIVNSPLATVGNEALYYQKDTMLGMTISVKPRAIVEAALQSGELAEKASQIPSFALSVIKALIPKNLSVNANVYPLAEKEDAREIKVKINASKEKHAETLSKIINGLMSSGSEEPTETFFGTINNKVVEVFHSVNEKVKINFVPTLSEENEQTRDADGNIVSEMQIMTIDTLLSLIDSSGELTAHEIFTVLKCFYIANNAHAPLALDGSVDAFKQELYSKYGLDTSFLNADAGLSEDTFNQLLSHMNLSDGHVDFSRSNEEMQVKLSSEALAAIMMNLFTSSGDSSESAESEKKDASFLSSLDPTVCAISVVKLPEDNGHDVFALELLISVNLFNMVKSSLPTEGAAGALVPKLLPRGESYFGMRIPIYEYSDEGVVKHVVGSAIAEKIESTKDYATKLAINDFTYDETTMVKDAISKFIKVLGNTDFNLSEMTSSLESTVSDLFSKLTDSDLALNLSLFSKNETSNGGILLPSVYEIVSGAVKPKLTEEETFSAEDAQQVLSLVYTASIDKTVRFSSGNADDFLNEINENYYINYASRLTAKDLFGGKDESGSSTLADKIKSDSICFKPSEAETASWKADFGETYEKPALYTDDRAPDALRVSLTGEEIAALVDASAALPSDMASSFGNISILGAQFVTEDGKTYLVFDLLCEFTSTPSSAEKEKSSLDLSLLLPDSIKLSTKILLFASSYPGEEEEGEHRFDTTVLVNDGNAGKIFSLMKAFGNDSLSEATISQKIKDAISNVFVTLEEKINLYYNNGGAAYTSDGEDCIYLSDVFTALIKTLNIKDSAETDAPLTEAASFASRLREYGKQLSMDTDLSGNALWESSLGLKLFTEADRAYVTKNMQDAYFMKEELSIDDIYGDKAAGKGIGDSFKTIKSSDFYLDNGLDENGDPVTGLYHYTGALRSLKISDKALGSIIAKNESFAAAVSGTDIIPSFVSLIIDKDGEDNLKLTSGLKISFNTEKYPLMPVYFYVTAVTTEYRDGASKSYSTKISLNGLGEEETSTFFFNISTLMGSLDFSLDTIKKTLNDSIEKALSNFYASVDGVSYGLIDSDDLTYFSSDIFDDMVTPAAGDGYISIPSVYHFLNTLLFKSHEEIKPTDEALRTMLNELYMPNETLADTIITNAKDADAFRLIPNIGAMVFYSNEDNKIISAFSDKYLASYLSDRIAGEKVNGNISLATGLEQVIIFRANNTSAPTYEYWNEKFNNAMNESHNYLVATIRPSLEGYETTGSGESIMPTSLWFTVLVDLDDSGASKGLLYDMSVLGMETFVNVLTASGKTFNIDTIACQLADIITGKINNLTGSTVTPAYNARTDSYLYSQSYPYNVLIERDIKDDITADDGVGYLLIAANLA